MRLSLRIVASVFGLSLLHGCSTDDGAAPVDGTAAFISRATTRFADDAVNLDQAFSNSVSVEDNQIVVPTSSNEGALSRIKLGSVIAGNRDMRTSDLAASKNPYGFLRRVKAISVEGATTVLHTEQAELAEWIDEGDLFFDDTKSVFEGAKSGARDLRILDGNQNGAGVGVGSGSASIDTSMEGDETPSANGKLKAKPFVKLTNASFKLNAQYDGYFRVRRTGLVQPKVQYRSHLILDPVVGADIQAGVALSSVGADPTTPVEVPLWDKTWRGNNVVIPIGGPIPITVRFTPELHCKVSAGGVVVATVHADLKSHIVGGFEGEATLRKFDWNNLSEKPSFEPKVSFVGVQGNASMVAECELLAVPSLLAFDAVGIEGKVGPHVMLTANACATYDARAKVFTSDFNLFEQHELVGELDARVQLPFLGVGKSFDLYRIEGTRSPELYLVGDKEMCEAKPDDR